MEKMESINDRLRRKYEGAYLDKTWATGGDGNSPCFLSADAALATLLHCSVSPYLYSGSQQAESPWPLHRRGVWRFAQGVKAKLRASELRCCSELGACLFWEVMEEDSNRQPPPLVSPSSVSLF